MLSELPPHALAGRCDPALIPFDTTDQAPPGPRVVGQDRALGALAYGFGRPDNHLFVAAPGGVDCRPLVERLAKEAALHRSPTTDLCYVFGFDQPPEAAVLLVPPGAGPRLRRALDELLEDIDLTITTALASREAVTRLSEIDREFAERRVDVEEDAMRLASWARERRKRRRALTRSVARRVIEEAFADMERRERLPEEAEPFLGAVMLDLIDRAGDLDTGTGIEPRSRLPGGWGRRSMRRYTVNILASASGRSGVPVVVEDDPSPERVFGWIETGARYTARVAPHECLRPGALHRAHGGIVLLDAANVLGNTDVWPPLRRAMKTGTFRPVVPDRHLSTGPVPDPAPSPFHTQVVLIGDAGLHGQQCDEDDEFADIFGIYVDFDSTLRVSPELTAAYAAHLADLAKEDDLRPVGRDAVARLIEHAMRLAGDRQRLTAKTSLLRGTLREADFIAGPGTRRIEATQIDAAIDAQRARTRRPADQVLDDIVRDTVRIETDGVRVGQLNGIIVGTSGGVPFAHPARITARVRLGEGDLVDIEREVELGGAAHSKGVLILSGFLGGRYAPDRPLSLWASLVFEQSYGGIDGDSASAAELACLLSAIGSVPVAQSLAVTGSINQHGELQAVGDVTEKIEGFFEVCSARGLTGAHGVVIPAANTDHLNLHARVAQAVAAGQFHIYVAHTIDDVLAVLSGLPAGDRDADGLFPPGSFNESVERRLLAFAEERKAFKGSDEEDEG